MTDSTAAQAGDEEIWRTWSRLVARAWTDAKFKQELLRSPIAVLEQSGVKLAESTRVRVVDLAPNEVLLPLPARPTDAAKQEETARLAGDQATARLLRRFQPFMSPWSGGRAPDPPASTTDSSGTRAAKR